MTWRASSGLRAWMIQRISAAYLAGFFLYILFTLIFNGPDNWYEWRAWLAHPMVNTGFGLFFLSLLFHAWIGVRDVIMDYISPFGLRLTVLILMGLTWAAMGIWVVRSLLWIQ